MKKEIKIIVFLIIIFIIILAVFLYFTRNKSTNIDFSKPLTSEEIVQLTKKSSEINNIHYRIYKEDEDGKKLTQEDFKKGDKHYMIINSEEFPMMIWSNKKKIISVSHANKRVSVTKNISKLNGSNGYMNSYNTPNYVFVEKTQLNGKDVIVVKYESVSSSGDKTESLSYVDIETGIDILTIVTYLNGSVIKYHTEFEIGSVKNSDVKEIDYKKLYPDYNVDILDAALYNQTNMDIDEMIDNASDFFENKYNNENISDNINNQQQEVIDNNQENESDNTQISTTTVSKLNNGKDWVYNADYEKNVTSSSYSTEYETYHIEDIVVPYINIDSVDAKTANTEIREIFSHAILTYTEGLSDKITYVDECSYKKYINGDVLSVILTYGEGATDVVHPIYYSYNFDLVTGNRLSYEDVYKKAGLDLSNVNLRVESAIADVMKDKMSNFSSDNYPAGTTFDIYNNESIENYRNSITNNTIEYFLSDDGKLNVVVKLIVPAGTGEFDTLIKID